MNKWTFFRPSESSEYEASGEEEIGISKEVRKEEMPEWEEEYIPAETTMQLITTTPPPVYEEVILNCNGYNPSDVSKKFGGITLSLFFSCTSKNSYYKKRKKSD